MKPTATRCKEHKGRMRNKVSLHVWITSSQDSQLAEIIRITEKEKQLLIAEALQLLFAAYRGAGVV